ADLASLIEGFQGGKRLGLMIRNERTSQVYTTSFMSALFEEEGNNLFDVRQAILGHLQQGGDPSPFDRIQATRLAARCIEFLIEQARTSSPQAAFIGLQAGQFQISNLEDLPRMVDEHNQRPKAQWWMDVRPIARELAQPGPRPADDQASR
ncbi:MAG TPA: 6-phosphofructokinase, partial [Roseiflexaceae bacterium]|nr:6-phosphofructokinase [Roseiflexaceae bacterium]